MNYQSEHNRNSLASKHQTKAKKAYIYQSQRQISTFGKFASEVLEAGKNAEKSSRVLKRHSKNSSTIKGTHTPPFIP